jgi:RHS repeat-associated protein
VTSLSNGDEFAYDANGNMVTREQGGLTWTHTFDAQNRLVGVDDGTTTTTYVYDGGGNRVKRLVDDGETVTTTIYVASMEIVLIDGNEDHRTLYYYAGGAFRIIGGDNAGLYFGHSDHLGSMAVLSDANGIKVEGGEIVFAPFGEVRLGEWTDLTDVGFTGQRHDRSTGGLVFYQSRYYLPELKRFVSADSIIPGMADPQAFNRYSYVANNPVRYKDPDGHATCPPGMSPEECVHGYFIEK